MKYDNDDDDAVIKFGNQRERERGRERGG